MMLCLKALDSALFGEFRRRDDFQLAQDGELLLPPFEVCVGSDRKRALRGCDRIFVGVESLGACTLARVVALRDEEAIAQFLESPYVASFMEASEEGEWTRVNEFYHLSEMLQAHGEGAVVRVYNRPEGWEILPFQWNHAKQKNAVEA